jgi:hypothetical protein
MTTLRKAIADNDLERFIVAREAEDAPHGDQAKLNRALASMAQTSKAAPATSKPRRSGG